MEVTTASLPDLDALITRLHATRDPALAEHLYAAYLQKSALLLQSTDEDAETAALAPLDALVAHAGDTATPVASAQLAEALFRKAELHLQCEQDQQAIAACQSLRTRLGDAAAAEVRRWLARADLLLLRHRSSLGTFARVDAVREARAAVERWAEDRDPEVMRWTSTLALELGDTLEAMDYVPAAIEIWSALQQRLATTRDPALQEIDAKALLWIARQQKMAADTDEEDGDEDGETDARAPAGATPHDAALTTLASLLGRHALSPPPVRGLCLRAGMMRNAILRRYRPADEVLADMAAMLAEYGDDTDDDIRDSLRRLNRWRLDLLAETGTPDAVVVACDALAARHRDDDDLDSITLLADALELKRRHLAAPGGSDDGAGLLAPLIARHRHHPNPIVPRLLLQRLLAGRHDRTSSSDAREDGIFAAAQRWFADSADPEVQAMLAASHADRIGRLVDLRREEEALAIADAMIARYGDAENPEIRTCIARGLTNKAMALQRLGRPAEERATYRAVIERGGRPDPSPELRANIAEAYYWLARRHLDEDDDFAVAKALTADLDRLHGEDDNPAARVHALNANYGLAAWLTDADRHDEAIPLFDAIIQRTAATDAHQAQEACARAMQRKAHALLRSGQPQRGLETADDVLVRFGKARSAALDRIVESARQTRFFCIAKLRELPDGMASLPADAAGADYDAAFAEIDRGDALAATGAGDAAIACYDTVIAGQAGATHPDLRFVHALALHQKSGELMSLKRYSQVIECAGEMIARHGDQQASRFSALLGKTLLDQALALGKLKRTDEAIGWYDMVIERFRDATHDGLRDHAAQALYNRAVLMDGHSPADAVARAYTAVIDYCITSREPALQLRAAKAAVNLALELQQRGDFAGQATLCARLLDRLGAERAPELRKRIIRLLEMLAEAQSRLGRNAEARATGECLLQDHRDQLDAAQLQAAERLCATQKPGLFKRWFGAR